MTHEIPDELKQLIDAHNSAEIERAERLQKIFEYINNRKGFRRVVFGKSYNWSNCWDLQNRDHALQLFVYDMARPITEVYSGTEK